MSKQVINKRSIGKCIFFSIITFGIYYIYWMYLIVKNIRVLEKRHYDSCVGEMLCLMFVPFYMVYWVFTRGNYIKYEFNNRNYRVSSDGTMLLVLSLVGLSVVSIAIMQNDFNSLPTNINGVYVEDGEQNLTSTTSVPNSKVYIDSEDDDNESYPVLSVILFPIVLFVLFFIIASISA